MERAIIGKLRFERPRAIHPFEDNVSGIPRYDFDSKARRAWRCRDIEKSLFGRAEVFARCHREGEGDQWCSELKAFRLFSVRIPTR